MKETTSKINRIFSILLTALIILTVAFIWSNSAKNGEESHTQSNLIVDLLKPLFDPHGKISDHDFSVIIRKAAHFSEFALLGAELTLWLKLMHLRAGFIAPTIVLTVASIDETIQRFFERTSSVTDVIIDFCGGIFGMLFILLFIMIINLIRKKRKKSL